MRAMNFVRDLFLRLKTFRFSVRVGDFKLSGIL